MSPYSREKIERYVAGSSLNVTSIPGDSIRLASSPKSSSRFFLFSQSFFLFIMECEWLAGGWVHRCSKVSFESKFNVYFFSRVGSNQKIPKLQEHIDPGHDPPILSYTQNMFPICFLNFVIPNFCSDPIFSEDHSVRAPWH